ncbi:divalent-cation tolerance protein CutA [Azospirillum picis]|uniref:Periplasmic divalent cation tolerance protein n=1 Tax=Azospirillum picis TaxID=488438 RepID=A0ABU0ME71_9PROT|nr:divalent-cation tolerance protein CutA [Azospirillum picis]MBP2297892.1 periplasmic divalent cation tolerance protein [Azospirillum picis]MDQ0531730.1 periplasmic divalent cation tolerance protein [Azospirillum picis]
MTGSAPPQSGDDPLVIAYITAASKADALRIGRSLVEERLAACAKVLDGMTSVYRWEGRVEQADEAVLIAKTRSRLFDRLAARVRELHGYDTPCVLELAVGRGNPAYLDWLRAETA